MIRRRRELRTATRIWNYLCAPACVRKGRIAELLSRGALEVENVGLVLRIDGERNHLTDLGREQFRGGNFVVEANQLIIEMVIKVVENEMRSISAGCDCVEMRVCSQ